MADEPSTRTRKVAYTEEELRARAAAFVQRFGNDARELLKRDNLYWLEAQERTGERMDTYKFTATTSDGQQIEQVFAATTVDGAAAQGWESIRERAVAGVQVEAAQLTWEGVDSPEVEYIYDRRQGIELYRPAGLTLREAQLETLSERVCGGWTLQQFSEVAGKPWYALAERDETGNVVRQFTGYRGEMDEFARQYGLKPRELPAIAESQFLAEQMKSGEPGATERVTGPDFRLDQERRREWNALLEERATAPEAAKELKGLVDMTLQELVDEARQQHAQFLHLHERFEKAETDERLQLREQMKPIALRENELRDRYLSLRQEDALGDFLQKMKGPSQGEARNGHSLERQTVTPTYGRAETIRQLRAKADAACSEVEYVPGEAAIARNLANQLEAGVKKIDLSQNYGTTNQAEADERHRSAIKNLGPFLMEARKMTDRLDYGQAIAAGQKEVLALNHDIKHGLARVPGVLQTAANHSHHVVQAPRLSMSEGLSGGGL
jgi:hypothetical protein